MNKVKMITLTACVALFPVLATAGDDTAASNNDAVSPQIRTEKEMEQFKKLDTDQSGTINMEEAEAGGVTEFAKADKNSDGELDMDEYVLLARNELTAR